MPNLNAVLKHVDDYCNAYISLGLFEDQFRDDSRGAYEFSRFDDLCVSIESALSDYHFGQGVDEPLLRKALAKAIRPFGNMIEIPVGLPRYTVTPTSHPIRLRVVA